MIRTSRICLGAALAVLLLARPGIADEPKKEPEKKPAAPTWLDFAARMTEAAQRYREAQTRLKSAEKLRGMAFRLQKPVEDPKKGPAKPENEYSKLLDFLEQDHLRLLQAPSSPSDRLGAPLERVSPALANQLKLPKDQGRIVGEVKKGSVAEKAGLRQHDILIEVSGKPVPGEDKDLEKLLAEAKVSLAVLREGKRVEIKEAVLAVKEPPIRSYVVPSDSGRGFEWGHLHGLTHAAAGLPKGYEVVSREPVLTTVFREADRFTVRLQEGTLAITVVGKKGAVELIKVLEGGSAERFASLDKLPPEYRDKAARLLKIGEKAE